MTPRRSKSLSLLVSVALAGLALLSWTQPWFTVVLAPTGGHPPLSAGGDVSAPALSALALASFAASGALAIAGKVFRVILSALQLVLGGCVALSAILALSSPVQAVKTVVTTATGVDGDLAVAGLVGSVTASWWPFVALACGVLLFIISGWILVTGSRWPDTGRKYQALQFTDADGGSPIADWDSLSGGTDPTTNPDPTAHQDPASTAGVVKAGDNPAGRID